MALIATSTIGACIAVPEGAGIPHKLSDDGGVDGFVTFDALPAQNDALTELSTTDPHSVIGVDPPHGRFSGDQHAIIRGNGFGSNARVWFGASLVPASGVVAIDLNKLQVSVVPGDPGPVDVRVQNGDDASTSRTLKAGYVYDPFYAQPSSGPTSGGTVIQMHGKGTEWATGTKVQIGSTDCQTLEILSATEMKCTMPPHPTGSVSITVQAGGLSAQVVDDAFIYSDSDNGFKGGLAGAPLNGMLRVTVFNSYTGLPVVGATVIAGDSLSGALQRKVDSSGIVVFQDAALVGTRSVTVAKKCYEPITFVDVPVDSVTVYLSPIMSPDCGGDGGDVPPVGGKGSNPSTIHGELVWLGATEFKRSGWVNVPGTKSDDEARVAYLFTPSSDPGSTFYLPDSSSAVRPDTDGSIGYGFTYTTWAGNLTLYALAGIENRKANPPTFQAYAFGLVRGVATVPGQSVGDVFIEMSKTLDQAVSLVVRPPSPGPKGPNRVAASVAVRLGNEGYAIFPNASRSIPIASEVPITFIGLPGLDTFLEGSQFVSSASAVTGASSGPPMSIVGRYASIDASITVPIDGFVQVPVLKTPAPATKFDGTHIEFQTALGGAPIDLTVVNVDASQGLITWTVTIPAGKTSIELPDLGQLGIGLPSGPVDIGVNCAHIEQFDYQNLQYRHLSARGWNAYGYDVFHGYH